MNAQDIVKALTPLADKLGQGAAVIWESALRQNYILGVEDIVWGLVWLGLGITGAILTHRAWKKAKAIKMNSYSSNSPDDWLLFFIPVVLVAMLGIGLFLNSMEHFVNPNLNALEIILSAGKNSGN